MPPPIRPEFLTIDEAAEALRLSRSTIYRLLDSGELAYSQIGRRRRIPVDALRAFAAPSEVTS